MLFIVTLWSLSFEYPTNSAADYYDISAEIRELVRKMSLANPSWGSPRIVGELRKLGIEVGKSTVEKYRVRAGKPPSPTWRAFLNNHVKDLVSIDFFTVPTVTVK